MEQIKLHKPMSPALFFSMTGKFREERVSLLPYFPLMRCPVSLQNGDNQLIIPPMVPLAAQMAMVVRIWFIVPFSPLFNRKETAKSTRK